MFKKAFGVQYFLLIIAIVIAITTYSLSTVEEHFEGYIGNYNFYLVNIADKAENTLFYISQSSQYALQQSIYELAQNGGVSEFFDDEEFESGGVTGINQIEEKPNSGCGKSNGANVWYELKKDSEGYLKTSCFDEKSLTSQLQLIFNKNLNQFLSGHPENILTNNYNYEIRDKLEIIGKARLQLNFDILKDDTKEFTKEPTDIPYDISKAHDSFIDFTGRLCKKGTKCILTKEAYQLLLNSQKIAEQKGVSLEVTSAYRSIEEQDILWRRNPNSKYVCPPSATCPHTTGKVVDIRFKGKTRAEMTEEDWKLLYDIMIKVGWIRYANEEWHFECCGTVRYARAKEKGVTAIV